MATSNSQELTTTDIGKRLKLSAKALNKILSDNNIIIKKGRPSTSEVGRYRPYWSICESFLEYGYNRQKPRGGTQPVWYAYKAEKLVKLISLLLNKENKC